MAIALFLSISYLLVPLSPSSRMESQASPAQPLPRRSYKAQSYRQIEEHISQGGRRRIAIAVQDKAGFFPVVQAVTNAMKHRKDVSVFYLAWDKTVDQEAVDGWADEADTPLATVIFESNTTWTTGRNILARAVYKQVSKNSFWCCNRES